MYIMFDEVTEHSAFRHLNILSAGFLWLSIDANGVFEAKCFGESVTLNKKSNPIDDSKLITSLLNMNL